MAFDNSNNLLYLAVSKFKFDSQTSIILSHHQKDDVTSPSRDKKEQSIYFDLSLQVWELESKMREHLSQAKNK